MGKNPKDCTTDCVKGDAKYVFVSNGKVYAIQNQDFGALAASAGAQGTTLSNFIEPRRRRVGRTLPDYALRLGKTRHQQCYDYCEQ